MKKLIYILFFVFAFASGFGQKDTVVETMPDFTGGTSALMDYLQTTIVYPMNAKENGIMGRPLFRFLIDSMGNVGNIEIPISSGNAELDNEGKRVISKMPKWKPGTQNGKNVPVHFNLPINFILGPLSIGQRNEYNLLWKNKYIDYYYAQGVKNFKENKLNDALSSFESALRESTNDIDVLYNKSATLIKLGRINEACETLNKIKKLGKSDADELLKKYCTDSTLTTKETFSPVEKMPEYSGGMKELMKFIQDNLKYPKGVKNSDLKCNKVFLKFVIQEDGSLKDIEIIKSSGNTLVDEEAKRVVSIMPKWIPGQQNEKAVPVLFNLPIRFADYNVQCTNK